MRRHAGADPRLYQSAVLFGLLAYGLWTLDFDITLARSGLIVATTLTAQWMCSRLWRLDRFDPLSPLISAGSLCLLLRTNDAVLAAAAAALAILSKFLLRLRGKHVFNPTNFALVVMLALTEDVWVSPGQWGSAGWFALLIGSLGGLVITRAARADVTIAFVTAYLVLQTARALWLGDPLTIPLHRLENGGLLLFAFFMISDPKTTPDSRTGRIVFAALCAAGASYVQFRLFRTNGLLWSLAICSLTVPILDWCFPGRRYVWAGRTHEPMDPWTHPPIDLKKEPSHAPLRRSDVCPRMSVRLHGFAACVLRLLRCARGHHDFQPGLTGGAGAGWRSHRAHDGQRLQG